MPRRLSRTLRAALTCAVVPLLAATALSSVGTPAQAGAGLGNEVVTAARAGVNPVTPGNFTGYGFDQCLAPTQRTMNTWLNHSPFLSVGIYISGDSRACRNQPNLTPAWISTQLRKGWRLLPITLGPQASCQPRFPRYSDDFKISPKPGDNGNYYQARKMGQAEASKTVRDAKALGLTEGSTLWYDLEGFDSSNQHCRESALAFLSSWTSRLHNLDYVSGVYSSAGSGIAALDDARINRPGKFKLPDMIWVARWDGVANTSTSYIRNDGWRPGGRVKQYQGGHDEVWGGVRINIDRNFLDVGRGSVAGPDKHCGGVNISFERYAAVRPPSGDTVPPPSKVRALQCLLKERGFYSALINGKYTDKTMASAARWQASRGFKTSTTWTKKHWMSLLVAGNRPVLKRGSAGAYVRRIQRALNADVSATHGASGVFTAGTDNAIRAYQRKVGVPVSGVVNYRTWLALASGKR